MLRRRDSRSSNRLSRQKSTSSVYIKRDSIDPDVARRDAHAAATLAFARAQERSSTDMGHSHGLGQQRSSYGHQGHHREEPERWNAVNHGEQVVKRQQSVRFVGPTAVRRRQSIGNRTLNSTMDIGGTAPSHRPRALTNNTPVPAAFRPPSRSSSIGRASVGKGNSQNFAKALDAYDEYYTREDDVASTPSSYRHVRKSKSMLGPLKKPSSILFNNGTPESAYGNNFANKSSAPQNQYSQLQLRAPKSMSFLRGGRNDKSRQSREDHDVAVQVARDKFFHQIEQQRLREQPSFLFRSKTRRQEKQPFRQSLRNSSTKSYGLSVGSTNQNLGITIEGSGSLRIKARKASKTIKNKLKSLFRRGGADSEEATIPDQQVESHKLHGANFMNSTTTLHGSYEDIPHPGKATISRVSSRVPSLHAVPSNQQLRSRNGSFQSLRSEASSKSRVTSWTSTALDENTAISRHAQAERERQRLSIIQENGTHVSSASFKRTHYGNQFPAQQSLHRPRIQNPSFSHAVPIPGQIDSQKVYSALMQRLEENSPKAKLALRLMESGDSFGPPTPVPPRTSSARSFRSTPQSKTTATIRQVAETSAKVAAPATYSRQETLSSHPQVEDDVFSPDSSSSSPKSIRYRPETRNSGREGIVTAILRKPSYTAYPSSQVGDIPRITPQLLADRNEGLPSKRGLRESRSTFFGHTGFTVSRTTSPYRRALAEADHHPAIVAEDILLRSSPPRVALPSGHSMVATSVSESRPQGIPNVAYSESIYSRTTSGRTPPASLSTATLMVVQDEVPFTIPFMTPGSALIVDRATYRPRVQTHRAQQSSADLRTWMSAQVATLEKQKDDTTIKIDYVMPTMPKSSSHHLRERAQTFSDDSDTPQHKVTPADQPVGILQQSIPDSMTDKGDQCPTIDQFHLDQFPRINPSGASKVPSLRNFSQPKQPIRTLQKQAPGFTVHHDTSDITTQQIDNIRLSEANRTPNFEQTFGQPKQENARWNFQQNGPKPILKKNRSATSLMEEFNPDPPPVPPPMPPIAPRYPLRQSQSRNSMGSVCTSNNERPASAPNSTSKLTKIKSRQLVDVKPSNKIRNADTPAKLVKRAVTYTPSPGLGTAVNRQFGSAGTRTPYLEKQFGQGSSTGSGTPYLTPYGGVENEAPQDNGYRRDEDYGIDGRGPIGPRLDMLTQSDAQALGSQRMVNMFLSSRRRRMVSDESNAFL